MITIFVGDNDEGLAKSAQSVDPSAFLIGHNNYKKFLATEYENDITAYTSFSDLPPITADRAVFFEVLKKADQIHYKPPGKWSDHLDTFSWNTNQSITEYFLCQVQSVNNNVQGLNSKSFTNSEYLKLADLRRSAGQQLWISGCSISHGVGVDESEKFGTLISNNLGIPVSYLTEPGSSIEWAKDQILRSDIKNNDVIIWGLTQEVRAPKIINRKVNNESDPDVLLDEISLYRAVTSIHQVVNFCRKISAQLILLPIICSERLQLLIYDLDEFYLLPYQTKPLDFGTDNMHPGPAQHRAWAEFCVDLVKD